MELDEPTEKFRPIGDPRPRVPEPPPVKLTAIEDVHLDTPAGIEKELDAFYLKLLRFELPVDDPLSTRSLRQPRPQAGLIVYHAENNDLVLHVVETMVEREDYRPIGVETPYFKEIVETLKGSETPFEWQKGLMAGQDSILTRDPAGNWIRIGPSTKVR